MGSGTHFKDVTERVLERTRGPVLVTKPGADSGPILVAVDRPFELSEALGAGIEEARATGSRLTALHCVDTGLIHTLAADLINGGAYAALPLGLGAPIPEAARGLRAELARRQTSAEVAILEGAAPTLIADFALRVHARLIVVGSGHGKRSLDVTNAVLRHAPCSVLVVDSRSALDRDATVDAGEASAVDWGRSLSGR